MAPVSGPMHVGHISGRPIAFINGHWKIICPRCTFNCGIANQSYGNAFSETYTILLTGVHVENCRVLQKPNVRPFLRPIKVPPRVTYSVVPWRGIKIRRPLGSGFDLLCPKCAFIMGMNNSLGNRDIVTQGNHLHDLTPGEQALKNIPDTRRRVDVRDLEEARKKQEAKDRENARKREEARKKQEAKDREVARKREEAKKKQEAKDRVDARIREEAGKKQEAKDRVDARIREEARKKQEAKDRVDSRVREEARKKQEARDRVDARIREEARKKQEAKDRLGKKTRKTPEKSKKPRT